MSKDASDVSRAVVSLIEGSWISRAATAVAVTLGEDTVYGQAGSLPASGEVLPHSVMYAASVTKQLTATLVALAVESGALGYEAAVSVYLPELPDWTRTVRVRHLLHHTSAVPEVAGGVRSPLDNARVLHRLQRCPPPERPAGAAFAYSNTGYVLLAAAIEARFQEPFPELVRRRIFAPLNLVDSRLGGRRPCRCPVSPNRPQQWGTVLARLVEQDAAPARPETGRLRAVDRERRAGGHPARRRPRSSTVSRERCAAPGHGLEAG